LCEHFEDVDVERVVQLFGRALGGSAAQSIEHSRNGRLVQALHEQRFLDIIAGDFDRRA
jgi:hypothetical protein